MIFKTFDNDIDKWTAKIGIFGKSFNELGTAVNKPFKDIIDNIDNFDEDINFWDALKNNLSPKNKNSDGWIKNTLGEIISEDNINSYIDELDSKSAKKKLEKIFDFEIDVKNGDATWQDYFDTLDDGSKHYIPNLIKNTNDLSKLTGDDLVKANQQARQDVIAHNKSLEEQTFSAQAGKVALSALATVGNMFASWAISKVLEITVQKLTELANASEIAEEKATGFANSVSNAVSNMSSNFSTLSALNEEYQNLSEGVNKLGENISLSTGEYDRYKEVVQQISSIMPNMTTYFNDQGEKIAFVKGELSDLNDEYAEYIQAQATEFLVNGDENGNKLQDALDSFGYNNEMGFWESTWNAIKNMFGSYDAEDVPINTMISTLKDLQDKKTKEEIIAYLNDVDLDANGQYLQTEGNRAKAIAKNMLGKTTNEIREMSDEEFNVLQESITNHLESLQNDVEVDMKAITSGLLQAAYSKDTFWAVGEDLRNDITTILSSIDAGTWETLGITEQYELENFVGKLITAISSNKDGIADAWNGLFEPELKELPVNEYQTKVEGFIDTIADVLGLDEDGKKQFMISLGFDFEVDNAKIKGLKDQLGTVAAGSGEKASEAAKGWWEYGASIQSVPGVSDLTGDNQKKAEAIVKQYQSYARLINSASFKSNSSNSSSKTKTLEDTQKEWKEYLDKYLALYKAELDAGLTDFNTFLNKSRSLLDEFYRDGKISAILVISYKDCSRYDVLYSAISILSSLYSMLEKMKHINNKDHRSSGFL